MYQYLIDGGYLSFHLVTTNQERWDRLRFTYRSSLILMDSRSIRREAYPNYKSHRKIRRDKDTRKERTYQQVREFRNLMEDDPTVPTLKVLGWEADDLVALGWILEQGESVMAIDKDMVQVPGLAPKMVDASCSEYLPSWRKAPKYAKNIWGDLDDPILFQVLAGDKSDDIPRLLSSVGSQAKKQWAQIYEKGSLLAWERVLELFPEEQVLSNLEMVLVPTPLLFPKPKPYHQLIEELLTGSYWLPETWEATLEEHPTIAAVYK